MPTDIFQALGLKGNPFSPATSTRGYFHTQATQRILEEILFGISHRRGFMLVIGEVGVGKTSLLLQLLERMHAEANGSLRSAWIFNTMMDRTELMQAIARDFGLEPERYATFSELISLLHNFFLEINSSGGNCAIIVDEAHNLDTSTLESLRLLSNLESDEKKLVQILLSGQPELQVRLNHDELRQLRSRIAIFNTLPSLQQDEIKRYVDFKLSSTSSQLSLSPGSCRLLWKATHGNVRLINLIMERSLHAMYALDQKKIHPGIVQAAINEVATFQKDVNINSNFKKKFFSAFLIVILVGLTVYLYQTQSLSTIAFFQDSFPEKTRAGADSGTQTTKVVRQIDPDTILQIMPDSSLTKDKLESFLTPHGQQELLYVMLEALWVNSPKVLEARLPENLMLAGLDVLPESTDMTYSAFPWQKYTGQSPPWIVLWEPRVRVDDYFPDYMGPEIKAIQQKLKETGIYEGDVDGYFGSGTWRSLRAFQEEYSLEKTGTPTPATIFWLFSGSAPPEINNDEKQDASSASEDQKE